MSIATRRLGFPARAQAYRVSAPTLTRAQLVLVEGAGEEELTRFVKARARVHGWNGFHVRDSEGVMESVHTLRLDGFSEGLGVPDWYWWHEGLQQSFWSELKGASGHLSAHQRREIPSMRLGGLVVFVWYPRDALEIEHTFRYGLPDMRRTS
jgi:hypothetical protein